VEVFLARHAPVAGTKPSVLVVGARLRRVDAPSWAVVEDAYEGLCRAGAAQPRIIVIAAKALVGVDGARYVRALRRSLPHARLLWVGPSTPRGMGTGVEFAADMADVRRRLQT
jgi:hypothetical protein